MLMQVYLNGETNRRLFLIYVFLHGRQAGRTQSYWNGIHAYSTGCSKHVTEDTCLCHFYVKRVLSENWLEFTGIQDSFGSSGELVGLVSISLYLSDLCCRVVAETPSDCFVLLRVRWYFTRG